MPLKQLHLFPILGMIVLGIMVGVWVFVSGCGKEDNLGIPDPPAPPKPPKLLFKEWDKPAAALVLSGEQHGYIEPCGCSETQSGGLARRADLIHLLNQSGWPVAGLDLGGALRLAKSEAGAELRNSQLVNPLQSQLKFNTQLKALESLRYSAAVLGFEEMALGAGTLIGDSNYADRLNPQGKSVHPVLMGANVDLFAAGLGPVKTQTVILGDIKIGVTAIVGDSVRRKLYGENPDGDFIFQSPAQVLPAMIQKLKSDKNHFNVLLAHATFEETETLLKEFPEFEIALCQSGGEEGKEEPQLVGQTQVIQVGLKGKKVGLLAFYPNAEKQKFRYELVELDNRNFQNDKSIEPLLIEYQDQLLANQEALFSGQNMTRGFHAQPGTFAGAQACGECHKKAYHKWKTSKHAHAYETLKTGRKGQYSQPISRIHDPECLSCHVTGWDPQGVFPLESGFLPEKIANARNQPQAFHNLQGQQCENCHGPGSEHIDLEKMYLKDSTQVERETVNAARRRMQLKFAVAKDTLCRKCHDLENSPKFDQNAEKYWEQIKHPWRD